MNKRPMIIITVSYIIGILWGIYLQISIFPFCFLLFIINCYFKYIKDSEKNSSNNKISVKQNGVSDINISNKINGINNVNNIISVIYINTKKYYKFFNICILIILSSNIYIQYKENRFDNLYKNIDEVNVTGIIIGDSSESEYYRNYIVKIDKINNKEEFKNTKIILKIKKDKKHNQSNLEYGDLVKFNGVYEQASQQRNYKGYDYSEYLKTKDIYGICEINYNDITILKHNSLFVTNMWINKLQKNIKSNLFKLLPNETASIATAILIGDSTRNR